MIQGSLVALVTPMKEDGAVDWDGLSRLVEFHVSNGTDGIVAVGTTGESATIDFDEHAKVMAFVVKQANGRIPVVGGTGANSTREAIHLTKSAKDVGCDAALLVTPYYNRPTQEGLFLHHEAIAKAVALPQILYNVPSRTGCDLLPETVQRIALLPHVIGIKEATGKLERAKEILDRCGKDFAVYSGDDLTGAELVLLGGRGVVSVTANVAPRTMHDMCAAALAGDAEAARREDHKVRELHEALFVETNPIPVKWALHEMRLIGPGIRLPMTPLSERHRPALRAALTRAGLL